MQECSVSEAACAEIGVWRKGEHCMLRLAMELIGQCSLARQPLLRKKRFCVGGVGARDYGQ
jgi:hypothetical protein